MLPSESRRVHFCPSVSAPRAQSRGLNEQSVISVDLGQCWTFMETVLYTMEFSQLISDIPSLYFLRVSPYLISGLRSANVGQVRWSHTNNDGSAVAGKPFPESAGCGELWEIVE